jgi:hypothetical protein
VQKQTEIAPGIVEYRTATHGGIWLSPERQTQLGYFKNWLNDRAWWEEDIDWAVPYLFFADEIRTTNKACAFEKNLTKAWEIARRHHPTFFERFVRDRPEWANITQKDNAAISIDNTPDSKKEEPL